MYTVVHGVLLFKTPCMRTYFAKSHEDNQAYTFRAKNLYDAIEWPKNAISAVINWHVGPIAFIDEKTDSELVFEKAISCGFFSLDKHAPNFAANYMFMGIREGEAHFKHINLRNYVKFSVKLLNEL